MAKEVIIDGIKYIPEPPTPSNDIPNERRSYDRRPTPTKEDTKVLLQQIQKWKDTYCEPLSEWSEEMIMEWKQSSLDIQQFIKSKIPN